MNDIMRFLASFNNSFFLYLVSAIIIAFVVVFCIYTLIKCKHEARRLSVSREKIKETVTSTILFSIAPSIAILLTVVTLAGSLGLPFPWMRLSVVGAIGYELPAAEAAAGGENLTVYASTIEGFVNISWVMTFGILIMAWVNAFMCRPIILGNAKIRGTDPVWNRAFTSAMYLGLIAAFLGEALKGQKDASGATIPGTILVSVCVLLTSALLAVIVMVIVKKTKAKWLESFALPIAMLGSMALAIVYQGIFVA